MVIGAFDTEQAGRREREAGVAVEHRQHRQGDRDPAPLAGPHTVFERPDQTVEEKREQGGRHAADEHGGVVARLEPGEDVVAQARRADRRGERGDADNPDGRGPDAGDDHRHGQWQLDLAQLLGRCHTDPACRLLERGVHARNAGDGIAQHG